MTEERLFSSHGIYESKESLLELFHYMDEQQITGTLTLKSFDTERSLFFDEGRIRFAHSNRLEDSLGQYLLRVKKINSTQFEEATRLMRDSGKRLGRVLLEMSLIGYQELWESVSAHLYEILFACFYCDIGQYEILSGDHCSNENIRVNVSVDELIWDLMRRMSLPRQPDSYLLSTSKLYLIDRARLEGLALLPYEKHVVTLLERNHLVETVIKQSELMPVDTQRILAVLKIIGLIGRERTEGRLSDTREELEAVNSPFSTFDDALRHYNTLYEMIYKMLRKEIGPIAMSIIQNALDEIRETLPGPFKRVEIGADGRLSDQFVQKTIWVGDTHKKKTTYIETLEEILYALIYSVRKNLGNEFEQQVLRWVHGDRA